MQTGQLKGTVTRDLRGGVVVVILVVVVVGKVTVAVFLLVVVVHCPKSNPNFRDIL